MAEALSPVPPPSEPDTLTCPNCQQEVTYYDITGSYYYGCPHCRQYFEYENEEPPKKIKVFSPPATLPVLSVGTEGYLNERWIRVVGYLFRKEQSGPYFWGEYVLLDQKGIYTVLSEYNGHWTYIEKAPEQNYKERKGSGKAHYVDTPERQYRLFNRYKPQTLYALGEFDYNVLEDDNLNVSEYIHPPYILTQEKNNKQSDWYLGEYKTPNEIATAFGLTIDKLPAQHGIGANQPSPIDRKWQPLKFFSLIALFVLVVSHILVSLMKPNRTLHNATYTTTADSSKQAEQNSFKPIVTPSFEVDGPTMLEITLSSPLDNQWVELPVSLINEETGKTYSFTKALEYYYGVDGGESWSEGSRDDEANLSRVPSGKYHLNLYPYAENRQFLNVSVIVRQVTPISNVIIIGVLLLLYPIFQFFRQRWFESSRWSTSDYSDIPD